MFLRNRGLIHWLLLYVSIPRLIVHILFIFLHVNVVITLHDLLIECANTPYHIRSGKYVTKGEGRRHLKSQGSCRTGGTCTAHMRVQNHGRQGVNVTVCRHHYGHENRPEHLRVQHSVEEEIMGKYVDHHLPTGCMGTNALYP